MTLCQVTSGLTGYNVDNYINKAVIIKLLSLTSFLFPLFSNMTAAVKYFFLSSCCSSRIGWTDDELNLKFVLHIFNMQRVSPLEMFKQIERRNPCLHSWRLLFLVYDMKIKFSNTIIVINKNSPTKNEQNENASPLDRYDYIVYSVTTLKYHQCTVIL